MSPSILTPFLSSRSQVPQQSNSYDCGLYCMHYLHIFLKDPDYVAGVLMVRPTPTLSSKTHFVFNRRLKKPGMISRNFGRRTFLDRSGKTSSRRSKLCGTVRKLGRDSPLQSIPTQVRKTTPERRCHLIKGRTGQGSHPKGSAS